jgi:hypothetical protein
MQEELQAVQEGAGEQLTPFDIACVTHRASLCALVARSTRRAQRDPHSVSTPPQLKNCASERSLARRPPVRGSMSDHGKEPRRERERDDRRERSRERERDRDERRDRDRKRRSRSRSRDKDRRSRRSRSRSRERAPRRERKTGFDKGPTGEIAAPVPLAQLPGAFPGMMPGMPPGMPGMPGMPFAAQPPAGAMTQQATRHARRIYIGGLPPTVEEQPLAVLFNQAMHTVRRRAARRACGARARSQRAGALTARHRHRRLVASWARATAWSTCISTRRRSSRSWSSAASRSALTPWRWTGARAAAAAAARRGCLGFSRTACSATPG